MLKLIQRLLIIALAIFIVMFVYISMAEACGKWVLEYSDQVGGRSGKMVNYCYYQDLSGSGHGISVQMPLYKECPVILDPCPEGGSDTTVTVNQDTGSGGSELGDEEYKEEWKKEWQEFLRLNE